MKMMRPHSNFFLQQKLRSQYVVAGILFLFFMGLLMYPPTRAFFSGITYKISLYASAVEDSLGGTIGSSVAGLKNKAKLEEEIKLLQEENTRMQAQVLDRNLLYEEVERLEEILGRSKGDNRTFARVVGDVSRSLYDTFLVDVGTDQGISVGNKVAYVGGTVIGEIAQAEKEFSKVQLYSSPGLRHDAIIVPLRLPIVAFGKGMGNFEASVPEGSLLHIGDTVVSSEGGYILGTIGEIERKHALPFAKIFFRFPFNISEIRSVEILKNS